MFHSAAGLVVPAKATQAPAPKRAPVPKPKLAKPNPPSASADTREPAAAAPVSLAANRPLGLRYSILKQVSGARTGEVDSDAVFRSGERIRLTIESNDNAYLYIVQRGSSGNWSLLFPSPEISGGNNLIQGGRQYEVPAGHWFAFDEQAGEEKLFIVLSRPPEPDLERMIYSIRQGHPEPPATAPAEQTAGNRLLAQNLPPIGDDVVGKIRSQVVARDLVFEKVDESTAGEKKEKAVYVVNRTGSADSRVIADVTLKHQ